MKSLIEKLKPGVRVIDINSGNEGWVTYEDIPLPNTITVDFPKDNLVGAISYPISGIENKIKLASKYGNYKVGDKVKINTKRLDDYSTTYTMEGVVHNIIDEVVIVDFHFRGVKVFTKYGRLIDLDYYSDKPVLKKLKVKPN